MPVRGNADCRMLGRLWVPISRARAYVAEPSGVLGIELGATTTDRAVTLYVEVTSICATSEWAKITGHDPNAHPAEPPAVLR